MELSKLTTTLGKHLVQLDKNRFDNKSTFHLPCHLYSKRTKASHRNHLMRYNTSVSVFGVLLDTFLAAV